MTTRRPSVTLDDPDAAAAELTGAKAAKLALARRAGLPALPGVVLTTEWDHHDVQTALDAYLAVSGDGSTPVVVRSSSTGEDGEASSMAGVFESVIDVRDEQAFREAVTTVLRSAIDARSAGLVDAPIALLVQPMLAPRWGGVLFGADPVTGRLDRIVVAAAPGAPAALVSGELDGWTGVLDRRGRLREERSTAGTSHPSAADLRRLSRLAAATAGLNGGPQDIEWAIDDRLGVVLLQARPITTLVQASGPVFGPGPVAETFPEPLSRLERELWLEPLRYGIREALTLAGTTSARRLAATPLVVAIDGLAAVDLGALGADSEPHGRLRRLDPRPPARRLRAAWRVGRLRSALPELAADVVSGMDAELLAVPDLGELGNSDLLAVLHNGRRALGAVHGYEALAGLLIPDATAATVTGASLALSSVAQARAEGVALEDLIEHDPVVLALIAPRIGPARDFGCLAEIEQAPAPFEPDEEPEPAAVAREALRLRVRWLQELTGRAAWELGRRLVDVGLLPAHERVRMLGVDELLTAVERRVLPDDLATRTEPDGRSLPARFRVGTDGSAVPAPVAPRRRRLGALRPAGSHDDERGVGAGGGVGSGPVHIGASDIPIGSVLVVPTLDPRLAPVIPRLAGLVAETGNPLSHLAILAREHHVPVVVGLPGATTRFAGGSTVTVDGAAGSVVAAAEPAPAADPVPPAPLAEPSPTLITAGVLP